MRQVSAIGKVADAIRSSIGKSRGEAAVMMISAAYPPGHPEALFAEWMLANQGHLLAACRKLDIEPPEPGPDLYERLKAVVMTTLAAEQ